MRLDQSIAICFALMPYDEEIFKDAFMQYTAPFMVEAYDKLEQMESILMRVCELYEQQEKGKAIHFFHTGYFHGATMSSWNRL